MSIRRTAAAPGARRVLLTGATGFIGGRLLAALDAAGAAVRCLVRPGEKLVVRRPLARLPEVATGDLLDADSLAFALEGTAAAYYLVHSLGGRTIGEAAALAERDRRAARNFIAAAEAAGVERIVYLGALGEAREGVPGHLAARREIADILQGSTRVATTVLRAAVIVGAGGASFEILRHLVERLPVMAVPPWIGTRCQPIAVDDVTAYLTGCLRAPATAGGSFEIGGPEVLTYRDLMAIYARVRCLHRLVLPLPVISPRLSAHWINLVTPVPAGVVFPLVEGLRHEAVCRDDRIRELVPLPLATMDEAIAAALAEEAGGPGRLTSRQAIFTDHHL
jgi:uncharacterized protein YbjT (DUF2867 family)